MNCTVCKKPVEEHGEGRGTDRCIAKKLGWTRISLQGTHGDIHWQAWDERGKIVDLPFYSSPEMSAETWGLVERISKKEGVVLEQYKDNNIWRVWGMATAPTPTLAICRAFLTVEVKQCQG